MTTFLAKVDADTPAGRIYVEFPSLRLALKFVRVLREAREIKQVSDVGWIRVRVIVNGTSVEIPKEALFALLNELDL
jgi:hypothetical protein